MYQLCIHFENQIQSQVIEHHVIVNGSFIPLTKNQNILDRPQLSVFRRRSEQIISKSLAAVDDESPWHLREPKYVR